MDKLEELERLATELSWCFDNTNEAFVAARDLQRKMTALRRDYALVPREPTQEDVERVERAVGEAENRNALLGDKPQNDRRRIVLAAWAAIVGEGTSGGTDEA